MEVKEQVQALIDEIEAAKAQWDECIRMYQQQSDGIFASEPFVIAFMGRFKTGKTSLLNALLGYQLLPTRSVTATAILTKLTAAEQLRITLVEKGNERQLTQEEAREQILNHQINDPEQEICVKYALPDMWFSQDTELWDTPGMDDSAQDGLLEVIAMDALRHADLCIMVFDASALFSEPEKRRIRSVHASMGGNVVYVMNKTNLLNSVEQLDEADQLAQLLLNQPVSEAVQSTFAHHYLICSEPGMIELDTLDTALHSLCSAQNAPLREILRSNCRKARLSEEIQLVASGASRYREQLEELLRQLEEEHNASISQQKRALDDKKDAIAQHLSLASLQNEQRMLSTERVSEALKHMKKTASLSEAEWRKCYKSKSAQVVKALFQSNFDDLHHRHPEVFFETDFAFLWEPLKDASFPEQHIVNEKSSTPKKGVGAGIGAALGFALAGPAGAAVFGVIGAAMASETAVDCSIENTEAFVKEFIVVQLRQQYHRLFEQKRHKLEENIEKQKIGVTSGLEELIGRCQEQLHTLAAYTIGDEAAGEVQTEPGEGNMPPVTS